MEPDEIKKLQQVSTIVNLHGTNLYIRSLSCGTRLPSGEILETLDLERDGSPRCGCMLCFGSTLAVYPAGGYLELTKQKGAKLGIVTKSETPFDTTAYVLIHDRICRVVENLSLK